jgi:cellulose synthase (UDP-forming)
MPSFLTPLIPMLEGKPDVAFVQTPQFYHNTDRKTNPVSFGAGKQQAVFYEYICESKGIKESMFCCGTNVVFRREALMSVGGFDEAYITEDMATSVKLHIAGWKSLYYNHVGTFGMGPEALSEYFKQQARWSRGSFGVLRKVIASFIKNPTSMTINQWIEYVLSGSYYLVGVAFFILMLSPIIYIIFDIPSFFIKPDIYITVFVPYFALSMGVFYITLRQRNYRMQDLFIGQMLTCITFPVYMKSAFLGLLGMQGSFGITLKGKTKCMPYIYLWPQITMILLNFVALVWGLNRFYYERNFSVLVNCFWVTYHFLIMSSIFYFNVECKEPENEKNK